MNVLVIGDVIIDRYTHGTKRGLSAETPTIVANFTKEEVFVGGAGLVVRNLLRLGDCVTLLTVGSTLTVMFRGASDAIANAEATRLEILEKSLEGWKITEKRRYYVQDYKLLQYDVVNTGRYTSFAENKFIRDMRKAMVEKDAVIVCDNRHGVMTKHIAKQVVRECLTRRIPLYVDSQVSQSVSNHEWYRDADFVFLNEMEADAIADKPELRNKKYGKGRGVQDLVSRFMNSDVVYKCGARGASVFPRDGEKTIVSQGFKVDAVDTCGAGDAFLAAFVHYEDDLEKANRWAALSTTYKGTIVPKLEDLKKVTR